MHAERRELFQVRHYVKHLMVIYLVHDVCADFTNLVCVVHMNICACEHLCSTDIVILCHINKIACWLSDIIMEGYCQNANCL